MPDPRSPFDPLVAPVTPPLALSARLRKAIADTPAPRSRPRLLYALLAVPLAIVSGLAAGCLVFPGRPWLRVDIQALPGADLATRLFILLILAGALSGVALAPGRRGLGSPITALVAASIVVGPLYVLLTALAPLRTLRGDVAARALNPLGLPCALVAFSVGAVALIIFGVALRRSVPAASRARGAALGAAAGAWAGLALFLQCPAHDALHLLVGHALPVAAFALVGVLALPRSLRP